MKVYRYEDHLTSDCMEHVEIRLLEFIVIKETPCGVWISSGYCFFGYSQTPPKEALKFVNLKARKKYACKTKAEAMESFIARKSRQRILLIGQLARVDAALKVAKGMKILDIAINHTPG